MAVNADGSVIIEADFDVSKAEKEFKALSDKIDKAEEKLNTDKGKQSNIEKELRAARDEAEKTMATIDRLKAELAEAQAITSMDMAAGEVSPLEFMQASEKQTRVSAELKTQEALLKEQDKTAERIAGQYAKITDKVISGTAALDAQKIKAGELAQQIDYANASKTPAIVTATGTAINNAGESLKAFNKRVTGLLKRVFVFSVITAALRALRTWLSKVIKTNSQASEAMARLKGALLTMVQPLVNVIIPAFITFVNILTKVISTIATLMSKLFGTTVSASKDSAEALNKEAEALGGVGGAAEEAAGSLASFDEINQITTEPETGGGGGGGSLGDTIKPNFDFEEFDITDKLKDILALVGAIAAGLLAWKIARAFGASMKQATGLALALAGAIEYVYSWLDAWTTGVDWGNFTGMLGGAAAVVGGLWLAFGKVAGGIGAIVTGVGMLVVGIKEFIQTGEMAWDTLATISAGLLLVGGGISLLTGSWIPIAIAAVAALALMFVTKWEEIKTFFINLWESIKEIFSAAWAWISDLWQPVAEWFSTNVIEPIKEFFAPLTEFISGIFEGTWLIIQAIWKIVSTWFNTNVIQPLVNFFKPIVEKIGNFFKDLWEGIKTVWSTVAEWFKNKVLDPIKNAFKLAFEGIKSIVKGIINGIIGIVEGLINRVISAINSFLSGFNTLATAAGKLLDKDFSGVGRLNYVSLPRLAQGAVIPPNREFMAVLGDQKQGTNIEAPLETIKQALAEVLQGGNGGTMEVKLYLDGKQIARNSVKHINSMTMAAGKPVILT